MLFFDLFRHEPTIVVLKPGAVLFRQGEVADGMMYVLVAGEAQVLVDGHVIDALGAGTIIGEMAMIAVEPRTASVVALTDCQFAQINRKRFEFLVAEMPGFAIEVMRVMAGRLRAADRKLLACQEALV